MKALWHPAVIFIAVIDLWLIARSVRDARRERRPVQVFDDVVAHLSTLLLFVSFGVPRPAAYLLFGASLLIWVIERNRDARRDPRIAALTRRETDDKQS